MASSLDVRNLSVDFWTTRGTVHALRDVSFGVPRNRILGVVGESGSGKSTILWSILGLLPDNANVPSGAIALDGRDLIKLTDEELRAIRGEEASVIMQDPMTSQIPVLTYGKQMLDILYRRQSLSAMAKRKLAARMLDRVGIPDAELRLDQYPHHFSGGMRQRAGIAMALITNPALLLADEPTTALDVTMEAQIIHLIRALQKELELTVVVVSHNLGLIAELCDEVVVMYAGEVVEQGDIRQVFYHARHPYTQALLECDPVRVLERRWKLPVIPGEVPDLTQPPDGCVFASRCPRVIDICRTTRPPDVHNDGTVARCHLVAAEQAGTDWPRPADADETDEDIPETPVRAPNDGAPLLEIENLRVRFRTREWSQALIRGITDPYVDAVLGASLSVAPGETVGLVGESGSGKTTLARAVLRLTRAWSGAVRFGGEDVLPLSERQFKPLRRDIAMMFQDPVGSLSPRRSVRALISEPFEIHGFTDRNMDAEAEKLCDLMRIPRAVLARYPHELSGGQARRVGVARALALRPKLIIADEPTAGLDVSVQGEILNLMAELQAEHDLAYVIITHNLPVVRHVSDRLAIMYLGRIVEQGDCEAIFRRPAHPYTEALVRGILRPDPEARSELVSIEGEVPSLAHRPQGCEFHTRCPYAGERCRNEEPLDRTISEGRRIRCHFPLSE